MSKYYYDVDYFKEIDTSDKAYWLGFLYADGSVSGRQKDGKYSSMVLELSLCNDDKNHLEKFRSCLNSNVPIRERQIKLNNKTYLSNRICVNCTKLCRDLYKLGCVPNKTYTITFPSYDIVPYEYMRDFIRGYFDGDGCICTTTMLEKPHIIVTITGMSAMLSGIADFLISENIIRKVPLMHNDKRSKASSMFFYGTDANKELLDYLYKDSNIYLDRKYKKYIDFYDGYDEKESKRGVYFDKISNKYIANIYINSKRIILGRYENIDDAIDARKNAEIEKMKLLNSPLNQK